jgi:hypothetical protein
MQSSSTINDRFFVARTACPVCGSHSLSRLYRCSLTESPIRDLIASHYERQGEIDWSLLCGTDYVLEECNKCGLIYQGNVPDNDLLGRIYDGFIAPRFLAELEAEQLTVENFNQVAGEMGVLFRLCGKHPAEIRFLDYGFGHGRWARVARALGATVFATEISEDKKAAAASIGVTILADEELDRTRFDIVHTEQVFEHLVEPGREFRRLAAVTDGVMKVAVPWHGDIPALLTRKGMASRSPFTDGLDGKRLSNSDISYVSILPLEHLNAYSPRTMEYLAKENGMEILSTVRRGSVALDFTGFGLLKDSLIRAASMLAKTMLAPDRGYYLFKPQLRK